MSYEESNRLNDNSFVEIMGYLIQKLESRYEIIIKFNQMLDTSNSSDEFFSLKNDLKLLFNDLEEDFRQGVFAIKALTSQNKKIMDNLKIKTNENINILEKLNNTLSENKNLKLELIKLKDKNRPEIKKNKSKRDINLRHNYEKFDNNIINDFMNKKRNYSTRNVVKKQIEKLKKNNYEFEQLSNIKNIMDNMKRNKLKLKMAIEQHFTNK